MGGMELAAVYACPRRTFLFRSASTSISIAGPVFGGINIVARSSPLPTQDCLAFGTPSQPKLRHIQPALSLSFVRQFLECFSRPYGHYVIPGNDK
jgi:hypothetical protein